MTRNISESDTRANFIDPKLVDSRWKIPVPDIAIQKKQVVRIGKIHESTKNLEFSIQDKLINLKALKSSLLNQAFSGAIYELY